MCKILLALCVTILVANVVLAESEDFEQVLSQEVNAILSFPKSLREDVYLDVFDDTEFELDSGKCIRPLRRCDKDQSRHCCRKLRCGRIIKRCLPAWLVPNPPETTTEPEF